MRRRLTLQERVEERIAWRWLRLQLTAECGITFQPRSVGRPPVLGKFNQGEVVRRMLKAPLGTRTRTFRALSAEMGVSECTIRRAWLQSVRERAEAS